MRYFSDVTVTTDVVYGNNVTVLPLLQGQAPATQPWLATFTSLPVTRRRTVPC